MMRIGYFRSTQGIRDAEGKEIAINTLVEKVFCYRTLEPGAGRPEFNRMMAELKDGDKLFVASLSTLARSVRDLLQVIDVLAQKRVALVSLEEGLDTDNSQGEATFKVLRALIELDKETMEEWKKDYIESAKRRSGKAVGRARK